MRKQSFEIQELDCKEESQILEKSLKMEQGITSLNFDFFQRRMDVIYDPILIDSQKILLLIHALGMQAVLWEERKTVEERSFWQRNQRFVFTIGSGLFLLCGLLLDPGQGLHSISFSFLPQKILYPPLPTLICYFFSIFMGSWFVGPKAIGSIKALSPDMNLLMSLAAFGAICIGQVSEAASVLFLFSMALLLESWSVNQSRKSIEGLLTLCPPLARVKSGDNWIEKKVEDISIGEKILIYPGEKIPLDGKIYHGSSFVNQGPITGESIAVRKAIGDFVYAGSLNEESSLEVSTTKEADDTTVARILRMVQEARSRRSNREQWVDRFAKFYTPIILCLSLLCAIVPPVFLGGNPLQWLYRGLVLLVIACPCALVISTPVSIVSALTSATRAGILIKGGTFLETLAELKAVAFDKTGTLTLGQPKIQKISALNHHSEQELLEIAAQLETFNSHPLAEAILQETKERGIFPILPAQEYTVFKGLGAEGTIQGKRFWIGSHRFMHEQKRKESIEAHALALEMEDEGHSVIAVGDFEHICGLFSISDTPRPFLKETIFGLKELGIQRIVMITGDNQKTAQSLAKLAGIDSVFSELLPEDKVKIVEDLKQEYHQVGVVGDGINDAPALASGSVGIAMGKIGTDAALESADIILLKEDLSSIPWLIRHARFTLNTIRQNIIFSLGIKALFFLLASFGFATLWMAIAADTGASLLVIFNGLRLLQRKEWKYTEN